jgi:hypothetical protein
MHRLIVTAALVLMTATWALAQNFSQEIQGVPTHRILQQPSVTTPAGPSPCERLLPVMVTIWQNQRKVPRILMTPEQATDQRSWHALCRETGPWEERLHKAIFPGKPYGQGWGRALGLEEPSRPSRTTTHTQCHGGHFVGYWCSSTTYTD